MSVWSAEPPSEAGWYYMKREWMSEARAVEIFFAANGKMYFGDNGTKTEGILWQRIPSPSELRAMEACVEALRECSEFLANADSPFIQRALAALDEAREGK